MQGGRDQLPSSIDIIIIIQKIYNCCHLFFEKWSFAEKEVGQ